MWIVEVQRVRDLKMVPVNDSSPDVRTVSIPGLEKGTEYRVRVRGQNVRGEGRFSEYVVAQTVIDRKSLCVCVES